MDKTIDRDNKKSFNVTPPDTMTAAELNAYKFTRDNTLITPSVLKSLSPSSSSVD